MTNANRTSITQETKIPWQNRILTRSLILFMAISLLPLLLVGLVTIYFVEKDAIQKAENALLVSAAGLTSRIEGYFAILTRDMKFIAGHFDRKNLHSKDNIRFLTAFAVDHPDIQTIWIADSAGRYDVLYSREEMLMKTAPLIEAQPLSGQGAGKIVWHGTRYNAFGETIITVSLPILAPWEERAAGSLLFEIRPQDIHKLLEGMDIGSEGVAFLVDESGHLVSHSDRSIATTGHDMSSHPEIKRLRNERSAHLSRHTGADGKSVLAIYQQVPLTQWGVVVERSESEVYRMRNRLVRLTAGSFILLILLVIPLAVLFAFRLTTPLARLSKATKALALGDLAARCDVTSRDEIGVLAGAFNQMADLRQKSEDALARERERLSVTLRSVGDGVIATDTSGLVVLMNKVAETLTGWTQEEAVDRPLREVFHIINETTRMICENPVEKVLTSGVIIGLANHTVLIARDGAERAIDDSGAPIRDRDNRIIGVILVFRDITERRLAENALRESEGKFRALFESAKDGIFLLSSNGHVAALNTSFAMMHGWTVEEMLKMNLKDLDTPETAALASARLQRLFAGETLTFEVEHHCKNGQTIPLEVSANMVTISGEKYILGFHRDIAERKQAEAELRHMQMYLKNVVDSMPSMLVGVDREGLVTQWNLEAEKASGLSSQEALGRPLDEVLPLFASRMEQIRKVMSERRPEVSNKVSARTDKEVRYSNIMVYPLTANGIEGAVVRVDDVTARVRIEDMMIQTEKMLSVGGLAAGMAHEINNPLGGILQGAQNILRRVSPEILKNQETARECGVELDAVRSYMEKRQILNMIDGIREAGERAARIISNMLRFSRKSGSQMAPADLSGLIDRTVELAASDYDLKKKYDFRQIEIVRDFAPGLQDVPCVAMEIEQVLLNLLKNAAHAIIERKDREQPPRIILRTRQEGEMARIEVEDNGCGMDEATRKRVFEPFFTTKEAGVGTGLGLSVSYFIVAEAHKGSIEVESVLGKGAKFIVRLPLRRPTV